MPPLPTLLTPVTTERPCGTSGLPPVHGTDKLLVPQAFPSVPHPANPRDNGQPLANPLQSSDSGKGGIVGKSIASIREFFEAADRKYHKLQASSRG